VTFYVLIFNVSRVFHVFVKSTWQILSRWKSCRTTGE